MAWSLLDSPDTPYGMPDTIRFRRYEFDASKSDKFDSHTYTDRNSNRPPPTVPYTMDTRPHHRCHYLSSSLTISNVNFNHFKRNQKKNDSEKFRKFVGKLCVFLEQIECVVSITESLSRCMCVFECGVGNSIQLTATSVNWCEPNGIFVLVQFNSFLFIGELWCWCWWCVDLKSAQCRWD